MKRYSAKTVEEAVLKACEELNVSQEELNYSVLEEKKSLFTKKAEIEVFTLVDVIEYTEEYIKKIITGYELTCNTNTQIEDGIIKVTIDTNHNSILIGKNGKTLQALNNLVRSSVSNHFKKRYRILLDINSYKDEKYEKIAKIAKRVAREVQKSHVTATLNPMTSDERRIVHNVLSNYRNIATESIGHGKNRQITIKYVGE